MSTKSTQRFVGLFVAAVVAALVLIAFPGQPAGSAETGGGRDETGEGEVRSGLIDPRTVLPVFELEDGWWKLVRYGMRMRLPEGWTPVERNQRPFAFGDPAEPLEGSLNVLSIPNFFHVDLESVKRENERSLEQNDFMELDAIEDIVLPGGEPALRMDYRGRPVGPEMRFSAVVFFLGGHQVVITAGAGAAQWEVLEPVLLESLASIELLDLPKFELDEFLELSGAGEARD